MYENHPSTEFDVQGLICVQTDITVCEREMQLLGIAHCMCHMWGCFPGHQTVACALGSTQPLKISTRIFLGVKT